MRKRGNSDEAAERKRRGRGAGEGSIYQRESDGLWVASVSLGYVNGKRNRKTIYGKTRKQVADQLKDLLHDEKRGLPVKVERQTVAQFLDRWVEDVVRPSVRPRTYQSYKQLIRLYLGPALGRHQLAKLEPQHVQAMMNEKLAAGLSPRTVNYQRAILRRALGQAVKWGQVSRNVAALTEPVRGKTPEIRPLSVPEARKLLAAAHGDRLEALYSVALALGLRQGEALGLRWTDVDLDAGTLTVRYALQRLDGTLQLVEPKTDQSRRTVALPATVVAGLTAHRDRQAFERAKAGARWRESGLVFTNTLGGPLEPRNVVRHFHALLATAGLPRMRFHDLRHTAATILLAQGVPQRAVMELLGHTQLSTTMRYTHILPAMRREAADLMERALAAEG